MRIIVGFFAIGKTTLTMTYPHMAEDLERKDFPSTDALIDRALKSTKRYALLSSQPETIRMLDSLKQPYTLAIPLDKDKEAWLKRIEIRDGNSKQRDIANQAWAATQALALRPPMWRRILRVPISSDLRCVLHEKV